jgi:DNA-binding NtrC family response regulator/tetratricopeptide (TPR) repeat protein
VDAGLDPLAELIGESPAIATLRAQVRRLVRLQSSARRLPTILLHGETGTGKGLLARVIHRAGPRSDGPFQVINCATLPENLVEAELFGFEAGAFTDARRAKPGLFQAASGGTLFLDEIALLPEAAQGKLLTAIEDRTVRRLGGTRDEQVDVSIIAATNVDLAAAAGERRFREDLYHRLAVVGLTLPALRDRDEDVLLLARAFLERACRDYGIPVKTLDTAAGARLLAYPWPGNVRELANVMERVALLVEGATVTAAMLSLPESREPSAASAPGAQAARSTEAAARDELVAALEETGWNISVTARRLGITRNTVKSRIARYELQRGSEPSPTVEPSPPPASSVEPSPVFTTPAPAAGAAPTSPSDATLRWVSRRVTFLRVAAVGSHGADALGWSRLIEEFVDKLATFGGRIAGVSPTGLVGVFGVEPMDDASRSAAHAAIVMVKAAEQARHDSPDLAPVRLAIHSDTVHLAQTRAGIEIDLDAKRRAVDLLDALVASMGDNAIAVSEAASAYLARRFDLARRPDAGPGGAPVYVLRQQPRGGIGHRSEFVGRREELDLLRSRLATAVAGHGQVVAVIGEAGIGKSRLLHEWRRALSRKEVLLLESHCHPHGANLPLLPLIELMRYAFRVGESDPPERVREKVGVALEQLSLDSGELLPYLLRFLGDSAAAATLASHSPDAVHARTVDILRRVTLRASRVLRPIVMLVEDLHWIDHASAAYLASLVDGLAGSPIMLVVTYREGYQPAWLGRSYVTRVGLAPLSPEESRRALQSLLPAMPLPPGAEDMILTRAEGNPFFLEELAHTLARGDQTAVTTVPGTVHDVLLARMERLPEAERTLLQTAAVIGRDFSPALLQSLVGEGQDLAPHLATLVELEFLYEATLADETVYAFKHALTHAVAYESLTAQRRRALHGAAGRALVARFADRPDEALDQVAFHYGASDLHELAVQYLGRAARRSADRYANVEAVALLEQAQAHAERLPGDARRDRAVVDLVFRQAHSLGLLGQFSTVLTRLAAEQPRVARLADPALSAEYHFWLGRTFSVTGARDRALASGAQALAEAQKAGDRVLMGKAHYVLGYEHYFSGSLLEGVRHAREAVALLEDTDDRYWLASSYWVLALNHGPVGEFEESLRAIARVVEIADATQDPKLQSAADWTAGSVLALRGDWDLGVETARRGLDRSPNPLNTALAMGFLGAIYFEKGDTAQAIPLLEKAAAQVGAFRALEMQAWLTAVLGEALFVAGESERARATLDEAVRTSAASRYWWGTAWAERALGRMALAAGEPDRAHGHLERALTAVEGAGARFEAARTRLALARADHALGSPAAAQHLAAAREVFVLSRAPFYVGLAAATARELGLG